MKVGIAYMFRESYYWLHRAWRHTKNLWYIFKCWAWKRYGTVKSRHLPHTWSDRRDILPSTMFEILEQFIEDECSPGIVDWYGGCPHTIKVKLPNGRIVEKNVRDEMQDLLDWWNNEFHGRYKQLVEQIWEEYESLEHLHISSFRDDPKDPDAEYQIWDPQYKTLEAKERSHELLHRANCAEMAAEQALYRRMHRLVNLTPYLWT